MRYWLRHYVESLCQCPRCGHVTWVVLWRDIWNHTWHMFWRWHFAPAPSRGDPRIDRFPAIVANIGSQVHAALLRHPWRCYIRFCTQGAPKWTQKKKKERHPWAVPDWTARSEVLFKLSGSICYMRSPCRWRSCSFVLFYTSVRKTRPHVTNSQRTSETMAYHRI